MCDLTGIFPPKVLLFKAYSFLCYKASSFFCWNQKSKMAASTYFSLTLDSMKKNVLKIYFSKSSESFKSRLG